MPIIECPNGHFYDNNKFGKCPICGLQQRTVETKNKYVFSSNEHKDFEALLTERYDEDQSSNEEMTISLNMKNNKSSLTTGWLVCVSGECIGKSFPIKTDRNFIGRDYDMDIVIPDKNVTRIKHCSIVYDNKNCEFYFVYGNGPVMVNNKFIETNVKLKENDLLNFGESEYIFIPYCKKGRTWND